MGTNDHAHLISEINIRLGWLAGLLPGWLCGRMDALLDGLLVGYIDG